jgi:hypothetical protein
VEILGSLIMHLGGHDNLGINPHIQIYSLKFHPIINNNNSGTHQVGKTGLLSTNILAFKDGEEEITKETLKLHLSICPTSLSSVLTEHSANFARICSTTFTSYSTTTTATISKCKLPETNTITEKTSVESQ